MGIDLKWLVDFLRDPAWQGVAGIIALLGALGFVIRFLWNLIKGAKTRQGIIDAANKTVREIVNWLTRLVDYLFTRNWKVHFAIMVAIIFLIVWQQKGAMPGLTNLVALLAAVCWLLTRAVYMSRKEIRSLRDKVERHRPEMLPQRDVGGEFEDEFRSGLHAWIIPSVWSPIVNERGLQLIPHDNRSKVLLLEKLPQFVNGVIECEVYLEPNALFDVILRGSLADGEFYMARLDARPTMWDCILFTPKGKGWRECNKDKGTLIHHSPHGQWLKMRIVADGHRISLYRDAQLVDQVDDAKIMIGRVGLFAEVANVYARKIHIFQTSG